MFSRVVRGSVCVVVASAFLLACLASSPAQSLDDDQTMLRDARYAVGGPGNTKVKVSDRYVKPAKYEPNIPDVPPTTPCDSAKVTSPSTKPESKLLPPRPASDGRSAESGTTATTTAAGTRYPAAATIVGSTCVVLSLFFAVAWLLKRAAPKSMQNLPREAVELLGRIPLVRGQQMHLVRCGNRLLLLSVSATATQTLAEVSDPQEVESLLMACGAKSMSYTPLEGAHRTHRDPYSETPQTSPQTERLSELLESVTGPEGRVEAGRAGRSATGRPAPGTMAAIVGKGRHA